MNIFQQHTILSLNQNEPDMPDWFYYVFGMMLVIFSGIDVQGQNLSFNNSVPPALIVCEKSEDFNIEFTNTSNDILTNVSILLQFPKGVKYVSSSLQEFSNFSLQESNITNLSEIVFSSNDLPSGGTVIFQLKQLLISTHTPIK